MLEQPTELDEVAQQVADLEAELLQDNPNIAGYLQKIHKNIQGRPELVHLLSNEQRAAIIQGLTKQTGQIIATTVSKTKKVAAPKLTDLSMI